MLSLLLSPSSAFAIHLHFVVLCFQLLCTHTYTHTYTIVSKKLLYNFSISLHIGCISETNDLTFVIGSENVIVSLMTLWRSATLTFFESLWCPLNYLASGIGWLSQKIKWQQTSSIHFSNALVFTFQLFLNFPIPSFYFIFIFCYFFSLSLELFQIC